jgi:hypothetical protein
MRRERRVEHAVIVTKMRRSETSAAVCEHQLGARSSSTQLLVARGCVVRGCI